MMATTYTEQKGFFQDFNLKKAMVNSALSECLTKIELVICLPQLLDNKGKILKLYTPNEPNFSFLLKTFSKFRKQQTTMDTFEKSEQSEKTKIFSDVGKTKSVKIHSAASRAIDILTNIQCLIKQRKKYFKNIPEGDNSLKFVRCINNLINIYTESASLSCQAVRKRNEEIRKVVILGQTTRREIKAIQSKQRREKGQFQNELTRKNNLLEEYIQRKNDLRNKYSEMLFDLRHTSESGMTMDMESSIKNKNEFKQSVISLNEQYNSLINNNLSREKKIKKKFSKIEVQLTSWISKYDSDIGEKRLQLEDLKDHFTRVCLDTEDVEDQLEEVNIFYLQFKNDEECEQRQKYEEIARHFLRNKAAFKIQRYWREYRKMKLAHHKDGKKKKNTKKGQ